MLPLSSDNASRSLSDLGVRREGKRDRDKNLRKFEANSELFNENFRKFWPIPAFPQQNRPKSDRLLGLSHWHWEVRLFPENSRVIFYKKRVGIKKIFSLSRNCLPPIPWEGEAPAEPCSSGIFSSCRKHHTRFLSFPSSAWERGRGKLRFPDRKQSFRG